MDITPGTTVTIEISGTPTAAAARKTLTRVCNKDAKIAHAIRRRKVARPSWQEKIRGGRFWHHQMRSHSPVKLEAGCKYEVFASLDVIRDLASIERWVKVST